MQILDILLVFLGLCGLIFAIPPAIKICKIHNYQHKGWLFLLALIMMFITGYLADILMIFNQNRTFLNVIVSSMFFGGGLFVWLVTKMSQDTIFKLNELLKEKHYQAHHDFLTGLPNRSHFYTFIDTLMQDEKRIFGCLMMDLNGFKAVNDEYGHVVGDHILQTVAQRIEAVTPTNALSARLGGDELTMILPDLSAEEAAKVAEEIHSTLLEEIHYEHHSLKIDVSIGIAEFPKDGNNRKDIMKNADIALYKAKNNSDHLQIFSTS